THVVHAAVMGSQFSYSDDHEPKNTAGRPALEVLKGSGITNIIVLIIRYFGGTLLGTGGLVKAYGDSTKMVLDGIATEELVEKARFSLTIGYEMYESVKRILGALKADSVTEDFATEISISGQIPISEKESLVSRISDLSNGRRTVLFN
ncbi:MAG: YigZ family protein, partial [Spirochaetales bacterium]|nr:YigZ family protein [Spirochaetales bacterium]